MPSHSSLLVDLASVEAEDAVFDPVALAANDADDFGRAHEAEVVDRKPVPHVVVAGLGHHRFDGLHAHGLDGRWPEGKRLASPQHDRRDHLLIGSPCEHGLDRNDVMIDCLVCVTAGSHRIFEEGQVLDADRIGSGMATRVEESPDVLSVVLAAFFAVGGLHRQ